MKYLHLLALSVAMLSTAGVFAVSGPDLGGTAMSTPEKDTQKKTHRVERRVRHHDEGRGEWRETRGYGYRGCGCCGDCWRSSCCGCRTSCCG